MLSEAARRVIAEMKASAGAPVPSIADERRSWETAVKGAPLPDGTQVSGFELSGVPCERVERADSESGVILHLHGGGYSSGSPRTHRQFAARLAQVTGWPVVLPEYRLAPEDPYPAGLDDVVAVYADLVEGGTEPNAIILSGDSAGAGLAAAVALKLKELGAPMPGALVLISPQADLTYSGASYRLNREHPNPSVEVLERSAAHYAGRNDRTDPFLSPVYADLSGFPRMLVVAGGHEVFLDDAQRLVENAQRGQVPVRLIVGAELWHCYPLFDVPEAQQALREIAAFLNATDDAEVAA